MIRSTHRALGSRTTTARTNIGISTAAASSAHNSNGFGKDQPTIAASASSWVSRLFASLLPTLLPYSSGSSIKEVLRRRSKNVLLVSSMLMEQQPTTTTRTRTVMSSERIKQLTSRNAWESSPPSAVIATLQTLAHDRTRVDGIEEVCVPVLAKIVPTLNSIEIADLLTAIHRLFFILPHKTILTLVSRVVEVLATFELNDLVTSLYALSLQLCILADRQTLLGEQQQQQVASGNRGDGDGYAKAIAEELRSLWSEAHAFLIWKMCQPGAAAELNYSSCVLLVLIATSELHRGVLSRFDVSSSSSNSSRFTFADGSGGTIEQILDAVIPQLVNHQRRSSQLFELIHLRSHQQQASSTPSSSHPPSQEAFASAAQQLLEGFNPSIELLNHLPRLPTAQARHTVFESTIRSGLEPLVPFMGIDECIRCASAVNRSFIHCGEKKKRKKGGKNSEEDFVSMLLGGLPFPYSLKGCLSERMLDLIDPTSEHSDSAAGQEKDLCLPLRTVLIALESFSDTPPLRDKLVCAVRDYAKESGCGDMSAVDVVFLLHLFSGGETSGNSPLLPLTHHHGGDSNNNNAGKKNPLLSALSDADVRDLMQGVSAAAYDIADEFSAADCVRVLKATARLQSQLREGVSFDTPFPLIDHTARRFVTLVDGDEESLIAHFALAIEWLWGWRAPAAGTASTAATRRNYSTPTSTSTSTPAATNSKQTAPTLRAQQHVTLSLLCGKLKPTTEEQREQEQDAGSTKRNTKATCHSASLGPSTPGPLPSPPVARLCLHWSDSRCVELVVGALSNLGAVAAAERTTQKRHVNTS